jgi:hypothetical protein
VLGVAAVGQTFAPASFSSDNLSVQVAAPGVNVPAAGRNGGYWLVSGTSPACALTAGVAALVRSRYPRLSGADVVDAIARSAWHRPPGGYDRQVGFGTVDAAAALTMAGQLAGHERAGRPVAASSHFGGGPAAVPAPPVPARGVTSLVLYCLLAVACLAVIAFSVRRLVAVRELAGPDPAHVAGPGGGDAGPGLEPGPPGWAPGSFGRPETSYGRPENGASPDPATWAYRASPEVSQAWPDQSGPGQPGPSQPGHPGWPRHFGQPSHPDQPSQPDQPGCSGEPGQAGDPGAQARFSARLPWAGPPAGRHVAPSDRGAGPRGPA